MIKLISTTIQNKISPLPSLDIRPGDAIPEWAARLCYNSNNKYGTAPAFINGLMSAGHYDVIEHAAASFYCLAEPKSREEFLVGLIHIKEKFPYLKILNFHQNTQEVYSGFSFVLCANLRTWRDIIQETNAIQFILASSKGLVFDDDYARLIYALYNIAPHIFAPFYSSLSANKDLIFLDIKDDYTRLTNLDINIAPITTDTGAVVSLLGASLILPEYNKKEFDNVQHFVFQIDHVSRAFTHQHVRHRLLSHSQASQRYIDERNFRIVTPSTFDNEQLATFVNLIEQIKGVYTFLRKTGAHKEDARAILPNCTETRIVSSAFFDGWNHYIWLRDDNAAQEEIRLVAQAIKIQLEILTEIIKTWIANQH